MKKPCLVIMAAGMGSRYGGLKQMDPVDDQGNKIIDFSIYDAVRAGFEKVIFIIKKENEDEFRECVGSVLERHVRTEYAFQDLHDIPEGFIVPEGRTKPWGTAHAVLSCRDKVNGPFAVINADDYYGKEAFQVIYDYLLTHEDQEKYNYAMVGYELGKTLTENGYVSRGICRMDQNKFLTDITERTHIERKGNAAAYTEDGINYTVLPLSTTVSMNLWGFTESIIRELQRAFTKFFVNDVPAEPLKAECYLPFVVDSLLREGKAAVQVLNSKDRWFGVTYKEDKPVVMNAIAKLKEQGVYPERLWD